MSKEQALVKASEYQVLVTKIENVKEALSVNLGSGSSADEFSLDRIHVPTGGGTNWSIPGLEGEESSPVVEGIIVAAKDPRSYWKVSYNESGGGSPPDCYSDDGVLGVGNPGGNCAVCPLSEFGSAEKGPGQACKSMKILFMLRKDDFLPLVVVAPPGSLKSMTKYFLRLASKAKPYYSVITRIALEKTKNSRGTVFSFMVPSMASVLEEEELARVRQLLGLYKPFVSRSSKEIIDAEHAD